MDCGSLHVYEAYRSHIAKSIQRNAGHFLAWKHASLPKPKSLQAKLDETHLIGLYY
jgi:hypothetical protein